jgi:hypothetical protein
MKTFMFFLLCALAISLPASAETSPQEFLAAILQHDFDGDGAFRIDKAIFTSGLCSKLKGPRMGDASCPEPREYFSADEDPVELVTKWEFAGVGSVTHDKAMLPVRFAAIANTMTYTIDYFGLKRYYRRVKPLAAPREVTVTYHLKRRGEDWVLVDPPLARVGMSALSRILHRDVQLYKENLRREIADPQPNDHIPLTSDVIKKDRDMYAAELAELDALAHRMNIPLDAETGNTDEAR